MNEPKDVTVSAKRSAGISFQCFSISSPSSHSRSSSAFEEGLGASASHSPAGSGASQGPAEPPGRQKSQEIPSPKVT